jgi:hypothetical protein
VRLEDQSRHLGQCGAELARALWLVDNYFLVVKLNPGLYDHRDHPLEGAAGASRGEGVPVRFERG